MCGGGSRWREEQAEVLDFAEKLHYDHSPGGSLIPETDDKGAWIDWRDDFSAWKDKNVALEDSGQAWWQTYAAPSAGGSGGGGDSGGESGSGLLTNLGTGIGPYPLYNMYFPQLVPEYETPQAQDWSQYGLIDPAYQPWTVQGGQQYVPENIWNYAPPQINRQPVQYAGPPMGGLMEVEQYSEPSDPEEKPMTLQEMIESGLYDGNPGYGGAEDMAASPGWLTDLGWNVNATAGSSDTSHAGPMGIGSPAGFGNHPGVDPDTGKSKASGVWGGGG